jgi:hypothetical protein
MRYGHYTLDTLNGKTVRTNLNNDPCEEPEDGESHVGWDERRNQAQNEEGDV